MYSMCHCSARKDKVSILLCSLRSNVLEDRHRKSNEKSGRNAVQHTMATDAISIFIAATFSKGKEADDIDFGNIFRAT